ncbi:PEP-CTERM sorting domain-containing protein [Coraliomargarita sp. W4R53]
MKLKTKSTILISGLAALAASSAQAAINYMSGYGGSSYHSNTSGDTIMSYDWGADGNFYTMTTLANYGGGINVYQHTSGGSTNIYSSSSNYVGASLVAINDYIYFNDSDFSNTQHIWKYDTSGTGTTSSLASTTSNYGLYNHNGQLFISGANGMGINHIFNSSLDASGDLVSDPATDLGETFGNSGPLAFDASGNLYFAPGYGDLKIYSWTAAELATAISDPTNNPLPTEDTVWYDYSGDYGSYSGGTGMLVDENGDIILSLTSFTSSSTIVKFASDENAAYVDSEVILTSSERLGDLRLNENQIYFSNGSEVLLLVPEPATAALLVGLSALACLSRRRIRRS